MQIARYNITETLFQGKRSEIYRAEKNGQSFILKVATTPYAESKLVHEFNVGRKTTSQYVVKFLELAADDKYGQVLVEEDDKAQSLQKLIPTKGFPPLAFLRIAIQLAEGLQHIHENNVIHKDIKPANIILSPETEKIKYIDFNSALTHRNNQHSIVHKYTASTEATLAYISPELTGRINQRLDYRTDFYSLGITFYQMLCGSLPFQSNSVAELVHSHLAKQPSAPHEVRPGVPKQISEIVMKMIEKSAQARYQSAGGLVSDLKKCLDELGLKGEITPFVLGQEDVSEFFCIPVKLYGRDLELAILNQACERVSRAGTEVVILEGDPGTGKSTLAHEMQPIIVAKGGFFLSGKYEPLKSHVPYYAIIQALLSWVLQVVALSTDEIITWKALLLDQLGDQGQLLIEVLPELELIIGKQPTLPFMEGEKAKLRYHKVIQNFLKALTTSTPILLFLDDLQWADLASIELIETVTCDPSIKHLLFLAAHRTKEAANFSKAITKLHQAGGPLHKIHVQPLNFETINQLIADTVRKNSDETVPLTSLIWQKTGGGPFFVRMFLQTIYDHDLFSQAGGQWDWNLEKIKSLPVTENLISFLIQKIQQLPSETQEILEFVSCMGHMFSFEKLCKIQDISASALGQQLTILVEKGLLLESENEYLFPHDRIQEAVLQKILPEKAQQIHLIIGRKLQELNETTEAVAHLNLGIPLIKTEKELIDIAKLNYHVGRKFEEQSFSSALLCLKKAQQCVQNIDLWKMDREFAIQLHKELAELEHLNSHEDSMQGHLTTLLEHSIDSVEKAEFYNLQTYYLYTKLHFREAIDTALGALKLLGLDIDTHNLESLCSEEWGHLRTRLKSIDPKYLLHVLVATDPRAVVVMKLIETLLPITEVFYQLFNTYLVAKLMNMTLDHGHSSEAKFSASVCAGYLVTKFGDVSRAYDMAQEAIRHSQSTGNAASLCKNLYIYASTVHHWKKPLAEVVPFYRKTEEAGELAGDFQYLEKTIFWKAVTRFYLNVPLEDLEAELVGDYQRPWAKSFKTLAPQLQAVLLVITHLMGSKPNELVFTDPTLTERDYVETWRQQQQPALATYLALKAQALYIHGDFDQALEMITEAEKFFEMMPGVILVPYIHFFSALIRLALYPTATPADQKAYLVQVEAAEEKMKAWAEHCPENFLHKLLLIQGEKERVLNLDPIDKYEQAIQHSQKSGWLDQALVYDLAARFFLAQNRSICARSFLPVAFQMYEQWGAKRRIEQLIFQYASTLEATILKLSSYHVTGDEISANSLKSLDLTTILKTSQVISSEVDLKNFLSKILKILTATAGAQKASFFVVEGGKLFVQAEYTPEGQIEVMQHCLASEWENGSRAIVDLVKRTQQTILLGNASTDKRFSQDPYITKHRVQSVLCYPILRHQELKAVLYLENNLASQIFSEQHMKILALLGGQIAISLENSTSYQTIKALNEQLSLALQAGNVGTWLWDMEKDFIVWDDKIYEMFEIERDDAVSAKEGWQKRIHPDDYRTVEELTMKAIAEGKPISVEYRIVKTDNSIAMIESSGKAIYNDKGTLERIVGVMKDITQRKKLEQDRLQAMSIAEEKERRRAEEAEKYRINLENFINQICHEIRNPMSGIFGNVDISQSLLASMKPPLTDLNDGKRDFLLECWNKLEECISQTEQCVKHQKAVVDDVLDLSKLESSHTHLGAVPFSLKSAVKEVAQMFAAPLAIKKVSAILSLPEADPWVCGDPRRLKIALTNILSNAVKFTEHGTVKISLEIKEISNTNTSFSIDVQDTGSGMNEDEQSRLFQRFARVAAAQFEGSGLGLYLSKRFVEFMGGTINVWSKLGEGSKFSVSLNLKTAEPIESPPSPTNRMDIAVSSIPKSVRVLVVEDNVVNQRILQRQLEQSGAETHIAGNGVEALYKWKNFPYDLIFMDIEMPLMGGFEATMAIRKMEAAAGTQPIRIVGLSAFSSPEFVQKAHEAGMNDYITKPYAKSSIHEEVMRCAAEKERKKRSMESVLQPDKPPKQARSMQ